MAVAAFVREDDVADVADQAAGTPEGAAEAAAPAVEPPAAPADMPPQPETPPTTAAPDDGGPISSPEDNVGQNGWDGESEAG